MEKLCKSCNTLKPITEYYNGSKCKQCLKPLTKKHNARYFRDVLKVNYHKSLDGMNHVYILPKENYAGITNSIPRRKNEQTYAERRFTDDMRVIYSTSDRAEALELEGLLHDIGYQGYYPGTF